MMIFRYSRRFQTRLIQIIVTQLEAEKMNTEYM